VNVSASATVKRFAVNAALYAVLAGLIGILGRSGDADQTRVVAAVVGGGLWGGLWSTLLQLRVARLEPKAARAAVALVVGALNLGGIAAVIGWSGRGLDPTFIGIAAIFGGLMQAARALSRPADQDDGDDEDDDGDDVVEPARAAVSADGVEK
jgi:hypothetical protein